MKTGTCLAVSCGLVGHVCGVGHCLEFLAEQHCQLPKLYGKLSMSDKSEIKLFADCHGDTEVFPGSLQTEQKIERLLKMK